MNVISKNFKAEVHYKEEDCPEECQQKERCGVMREAVELTRIIMKKLGDKDPIFKGLMYLGRASLIYHLNYNEYFLTLYSKTLSCLI